MSILAKNKSARRDYDVDDTLMAGIVLSGHEVKSIKTGHITLKGSYVSVRANEVFLINAHVPMYEHADIEDYEPTRPRKLLLNRKEIEMIAAKKQQGLTAFPLAIKTQRGRVKVEIGIGRGRQKVDKRHALKRADDERRMQRSIIRK